MRFSPSRVSNDRCLSRPGRSPASRGSGSRPRSRPPRARCCSAGTAPRRPSTHWSDGRRSGRGRDREVGDGRAGRCEPQFRVGGQVSDDGDGGVTSHEFLLQIVGRAMLGASLRKRYDSTAVRRLVLVGPHHLGPQHGLVQAELTVELGHRGGLGLHVDDGVDALGVLEDLVRQPALAPDVDLVDRATVLADDVQERLQRRGIRCARREWGRG